MRQGIRQRIALLAGVLLLNLAATGTAAAAQAAADDARGWIQRMNQTLTTRNYDGVFNQHFGERSEVMRIVHRVKDGEVTERVVSTDGSGYQQKRIGSVWAQFIPDKKRVDVSTRSRSIGYFPALIGLDNQAARHYDIVDGGVGRLLGRDVQLIRIDAGDAMRYGYRFWLDRQSALPLKFQRVSHDGRVLKEIAFISPPLLPDAIAEDQLRVGLDTKDFTWVNNDPPMRNPELKRPYALLATLLPPGYRTRVFNSQAQEARSDGPRARFIVSDGVSSAEVFLTPASGKARPAGGWARGPMASYQLRLDDVEVRVVGEMPEAAARAIAEAVRPE